MTELAEKRHYRWYSNINWGETYDAKAGAHYYRASDIDELFNSFSEVDAQSVQVETDDGVRLAVKNIHLERVGP